MATAKQIENVRCGGCVWVDKELGKCIFSLKYPKAVTLSDFSNRINNVNQVQQDKLSETFRRFI
jgi:hypothetical protein